jgi:DNA-binding XRE family transcriptional regulator
MQLVELVRAAKLPEPCERKAIREAAGATLAEVGTELGVTDATVHRWERGRARPRREHAIAYARLLSRLSKVSQ